MVNYNQFNPEPEEHLNGSVIHDFVEFSGIPFETVKSRILEFQKINTEDFNKRESAYDFYENSKTYIYDLLGANWNLVGPANKINTFIPGIMQLLQDHPGKSFMEFGGGLGVFTQIIKEHTGKDITYVDVKGYISDFALWRFKKYNLDIETILIPQDDFSFNKTFDIIYTEAVWEHLTPEVQIDYLYKLDKYINVGGLLVLLIDLSGENDDMPMHYNVDIVKICNTMKSLGYKNLWADNNFATVWFKEG
jgi:protein-L-isoaspartate O-methyltransferase